MKDYKDTNIEDLMNQSQDEQQPVNSSDEHKPEKQEEPKKQFKSMLPKTPTGTRINKRGKNLILLAGAGLGVYIVWAIFGLSPKAQSTVAAPESITITASRLSQQHDQGKTLVSGLRTQAYGSAANASTTDKNNIPGNLAGVTKSAKSALSTNTSDTGSSSTFGEQSSHKQIIQNGMQSSLTPNGFQDAGSQSTSSGYNSYTNHPATNNGAGAAIAADAASIQALSGDKHNQNMQGEKKAFLDSNHTQNDDSLKHGVQTPISPYMVMAGTVIPATLITGIDSDLPGQIQAIVSQNVYDTRTGNYVLIPQGSKLIGTYDSQIAYGQSRVLIVWNRVLLPDDQYIDLQGMPGADLSGFAGLTGDVNNHYFRIYGSALLMSLFSSGMQLSQPKSNNVNGAPTNQQIIAGAMGQELGQVAIQQIQKNLNIQPTIDIQAGMNFRVLVTRDIPFSAPYKDNMQQKVLLPTQD